MKSFFLYMGAWAGIMGGLWAFAEVAEKGSSRQSKREMAKKIQNFDPVKMLSGWPDICTAMFNAVFGRRHFSWKCFRRSLYSSIFFVAITAAILSILQPEAFIFWYELILMLKLSSIRVIFIFIFILNLLPDYLSLLKTRYIIDKMRGRDSLCIIFILLFLDFFITVIIAYLSTLSLAALAVWFTPQSLESQLSVYFVMIEESGLFFGTLRFFENMFLKIFATAINIVPVILPLIPVLILSIFFYATFFTSIWVWIFAISCIVLNLAIRSNVSVRVNRLKKYYDIENRPHFSISRIMMQIITLIFLVSAPFVLFWNSR